MSGGGISELVGALQNLRRDTAPDRMAVRQLIDAIRPAHPGDGASAQAHLHTLLAHLDADPALAAALRYHVLGVLSARHSTSFFTDSGILPPTGFFTELGRIAVARVLPELPDDTELRDAMREWFHRPRDWEWLDALPPDTMLRLWRHLMPGDELSPQARQRLTDELLEAVLVLACRIAGMGVEGELARLLPDVRDCTASFLAVAREAHEFVAAYRAHLDAPNAAPIEDERQLLVIVDQCRTVLRRAHRGAMHVGASTRLTFILTRTQQCLVRLEALVRMLGARYQSDAAQVALQGWAAIAHDAVRAENRRNSLRAHLADGLGLLALRVTDHAAQTGEHYIANSRPEYFGMWRSAMGAGVIIAAMAMLKVFAGKVDASLALQALMYSLNYGLGFVIIYMLHLTIATKQPAMTAQTLAGQLGEASRGRLADLDRLVDLIAAVSRTQIAAILGNVLIALPTGIVIAWILGLSGASPISPEKAAHLLHDLDPRGAAIPHAAIAGVFLFLSGLISGYFDNKARLDRIGARVAQLGWLTRWVGPVRARRLGVYLETHLGGMMGNFLFGCMLGTTGIIGIIFGLPIDIRHIAFASANLGFAWVGSDFAVPWQTLALAVVGVGLVGLTNLAVSFSLALWMALKARGVEFRQGGALIARLWQRLRQSPRQFLLAPVCDTAPQQTLQKG